MSGVASVADHVAGRGARPDRTRSGFRPARLGPRDNLNACLAGLLVAELQLDDAPSAPILEAASEVLEQAGPKLKSVMSAMSRGIERRLGVGTWDAVVGNLVDARLVSPAEGGLRPSHRVLDHEARDAIVARLQLAAAGDDPLDVRTAVLLSMTGPAQLLELVAPAVVAASTPVGASTTRSTPRTWGRSRNRCARCWRTPRQPPPPLRLSPPWEPQPRAAETEESR